MAAKTTEEGAPEVKEAEKQTYAFPEYGLTVKANSLEEANTEVKKLLTNP